jgi:hypothetical protein
LHVSFGLTIEKLWGFEDFSPSLGMLSANALSQCECRKICPNLPKTAQNLSKDKTLKYHQKSRFECFSKENHMLFLLSKKFSIPSCGKFFLATLHNFGEFEILHTCT